MNSTLSNNFVMEKDVGEDVASKIFEGNSKKICLAYSAPYHYCNYKGKEKKTAGSTLKSFTRDTNIEGVNNAGRSDGRVRR